jgi:hypothetical protein
MLPTVKFFDHDVTRVVVGDNPAHGNSYIHDIYTNEEMNEFYSHENTVQMLVRAVETGHNTALLLASPKMLNALRDFNKNYGGGLKIIFQTYPPSINNFAENVDEMMEFEPIAIYHQGSTGEHLVETGDTETYLINFETIRAKGVPAGMAFHNPENVLRAERENWGSEFYVLCPYNTRRNRKGEQSSFITGKSKSELVFHPDDRLTMFPIIRAIKKPVVVIKALAGGQILIGKKEEEYPAVIEKYMAEVFDNIKPNDIICVGVYQKYKDQLKENAEIVSRILGGSV